MNSELKANYSPPFLAGLLLSIKNSSATPIVPPFLRNVFAATSWLRCFLKRKVKRIPIRSKILSSWDCHDEEVNDANPNAGGQERVPKANQIQLIRCGSGESGCSVFEVLGIGG